ncbi:MAG: type II toxin-antitoxin system VapC family toxin [Deltaproteobacteria bacterium]|nr:type II toxin-antitoxin system VapC family toxin [Deltaproteobacteria bacterium]
MSVINLGEIWYSTIRGYSESVAQQLIQEIFSLGIQIIDSDWPLVKQAATFKARGRISYADCFAAALAKRETAELVTGDLEFKQFEDEIKIIWLKN